jgi:hypothetical protein
MTIEHPARDASAFIHCAIVDDHALGQLLAEIHILGDREIGRNKDFLLNRTMPRRSASTGPVSVTVSPSILNSPRVGCKWPASSFMRVDLPAPFSSMIA